MSDPEQEAYLKLDGQRIELQQSCTIGRSRSCAINIDDHLTSREHAMVVFDDRKQRWMLVDLASTNGTYLNDARIASPTALKEYDEIRIGTKLLVFRGSETDTGALETVNSANTIVSVEKSTRWLLFADVRNSTRLLQQLPDSELTFRVREWVGLCRPVVEKSGGVINEYLGDGFVAFWRADEVPSGNIASALCELHRLETEDDLDFRVIVHLGEVSAGAAVSSGLDKMAGPDVNFLFKCEKAVRRAENRIVLSDAAAQVLSEIARVQPLLTAPVDGFDGRSRFFSLLPCPASAFAPASLAVEPQHQGTADDQ